MTRDALLARQEELQQTLARLDVQRLLTQGALLEVERMLNGATPPSGSPE